MKRAAASAILLIALIVPVSAQNVPARAPNTAEVLIARDRVAGKITEREALRHTVQRLFKPEALPDRYRNAVPEPRNFPCLTPQIVDLHRNWDKLDEDARSLIPAKFHRGKPVRGMAVRKGTLRAGAPAPGALFKGDGGELPYSPDVGEHTYATTNFLIHWDSSGTDPDRLRQTADGDSDGIPDMIEQTGIAFETTWTWFVNHGYNLPPGTTDYYYNVYFEKADGWWGYSVPVDSLQASRSFISMASDFSGGYRTDGSVISALDSMRTTASHEFFHAVQFGYDSMEDPWLMEGCATWVMDVINAQWDAIDDYTYWVSQFLYYPEYALDYPYVSSHWYMTCLWPIYLTAHVDPDMSIIREIWEQCEVSTGVDACETVLAGYAPGGMREIFADFLVANLTMDYPEAADWPQDYSHLWYNYNVYSYPAINRSPEDYLPQGLGANYVRFYPTATPDLDLMVSFAGDFGDSWIGWLGAYDGADWDIKEIVDGGPEVGVAGFTDDYYKAVLIVSPYVLEDWTEYWFTFSAFVGGDARAPEPNPMTWATPPHPVSATAIAMTASTAVDAASPPVQYEFGESTGSSGATDSAWTAETSYTDSGLAPNTLYTWQVRARDAAATPNNTQWSAPLSVYTLCNVPDAPILSDPAATKIYIDLAEGDGNSASTQYAAYNSTSSNWVGSTGAPSAVPWWGARAQWTNMRATGLSPSTPYTFRVKARNGDGVETALGGGATLSTLSDDTVPPVMSGVATVPTWIKEGLTTSAVLAATASDRTTGGSDVTRAEYFIGADPGQGSGTAMSAVDGAFDSPFEAVTANLNTSSWTVAANPYDIYVRCRDDSGRWSAPLHHVVTVADASPPARVADLAAAAAPEADGIGELAVDSVTDEMPTHPAEDLLDGSAATYWSTAPADEPAAVEAVFDIASEQLYYKVTLTASARPELFPPTFKVKLGNGVDWWTVVSEADYAAEPGAHTWQFAPRLATRMKICLSGMALDEGAGKYVAEIAEAALTSYSGGAHTIDLDWTAPSDVGPLARASSYEVKYDADSEKVEAFTGLAAVAGAPDPAAPGSPEAMSVSGLRPGIEYFFALASVDEYGNRSAVSNVASAATLVDPTPYIALSTPVDGANLDVYQRPVFTWEANIYDTFRVQFSNVADFPARPYTDADSRPAKTVSLGVKRGMTSFTPSAAQWKSIKALAAMMHGTVYWRVEGKSSRDRALGAGYSQVYSEYGFHVGTFFDAELYPYFLRGAQKAIWPDGRPLVAWSVTEDAFSAYFIDFSVSSDINTYDKADTVVVQCRNTAKNMVPTWYKPTDADWKKVKKQLAARNGGIVYWRVRGVDFDRAYSCGGDVQELLIASPEFHLREPLPRSDGTVEPGLPFVLQWTVDGEGYASFQVQISADDQFVKGTGTIAGRPVKTSEYPITAADVTRIAKILAAAGTDTFYWRVLATDVDRTMTIPSPARTVRVSEEPANPT